MGGALAGAAGKVFGHLDDAATNSVDGAGKVVATGTPGASEVADPNMGLSIGNRLARGLTSGLGKGLQNQQRQPQGGGGASPIVAPGQPELGVGAYGGGQQVAPYMNPYFYGRQ